MCFLTRSFLSSLFRKILLLCISICTAAGAAKAPKQGENTFLQKDVILLPHGKRKWLLLLVQFLTVT